MSLKLCCALPAALNCMKHARLLFLSSENITLTRSYVKPANVYGIAAQSRWISTNSNKTSRANAKPKNPVKRVYSGVLAPHMKAVKVFSLSSSLVGLVMQPFLYKEIVSTGNVPIILAAYSFIGFFTVITPLLLHSISKKYITELSYNEDTGTYLAKTLNFFCIVKQIEFKPEDVYVPDVPGMFVTFHIKGKPLFVDPRTFEQPEHYAKLMGYDKPLDLKLFEKVSVDSPNSTATNSTSNSNK